MLHQKYTPFNEHLCILTCSRKLLLLSMQYISFFNPLTFKMLTLSDLLKPKVVSSCRYFSNLLKPKIISSCRYFPNFHAKVQSALSIFKTTKTKSGPHGRPNFAGATFPNFDLFKTTKTKSGTWTTEFCRGNFPKHRLSRLS